jgi:hypothetical protein
MWDFEFKKVEPPVAVVTFNAKPFGRWATGVEFCGCEAEFHLENGRWLVTSLKLLSPGSTDLLEMPR